MLLQTKTTHIHLFWPNISCYFASLTPDRPLIYDLSNSVNRPNKIESSESWTIFTNNLSSESWNIHKVKIRGTHRLPPSGFINVICHSLCFKIMKRNKNMTLCVHILNYQITNRFQNLSQFDMNFQIKYRLSPTICKSESLTLLPTNSATFTSLEM